MIACGAPFHILDFWPVLAMAGAGATIYYSRAARLVRFARGLLPILVVAATVASSGCSGAMVWRGTYIGAASTKELVTTAHKVAWSDPLNAQADQCETVATTIAEFDACMGAYANADDVVVALEAYTVVAHSITAVLIATDPNDPNIDRAALRKELGQLVGAARSLVALFPKGKPYLDKLDLLSKAF